MLWVRSAAKGIKDRDLHAFHPGSRLKMRRRMTVIVAGCRKFAELGVLQLT
jgi:hypothetical protein